MERTLRYLFAMLCGALPALLLFFSLRPLRLRRLKRNGLYTPSHREAALAPRWVVRSLAGLPLGMPWNADSLPFFSPGNVNLIPFDTFSQSIYILVANVILFMPFGLFSALLWRGFGWKRALLAGGCITLFIESCQLFIGRTFDIDDLMLNTLGVFCGFLLTPAVRRLCPRLAAKLLVFPITSS